MKTGPTIVQVNYAFDNTLRDPDALLDRYTTLTGWSGAVLDAGAGRSAVVQQFHRRARLSRSGVDYFCVDGDLAGAVAGLDPDIVHVNGLIFPLRTWRLRRRLPASAVLVVQNHSDGIEVGRAPLLRLAGRMCRGAADAFLFAAEEHAAAWRRAGFIARGQPTHCVMPASTTQRALARDDARASTGVTGAPAVLWVGRLNANKDPLTVLDAFAAALPSLPRATLTMIYGTAELLAVVRGRIDATAALRDRVRLIGSVPHAGMPAFFSAADVFVVGSHHEGSGYSLMEALACGVSPAVTAIPTFGLLTRNGSIGALWRPGDAADAARALISAARRASDAERARVADHFERHFSWRAIGRRALEIYTEVAARRAIDLSYFAAKVR